MDQRELVDRAGRGDHDAFAVLAAAAIDRLDATARLILGDPDLAKDAVQEALDIRTVKSTIVSGPDLIDEVVSEPRR